MCQDLMKRLKIEPNLSPKEIMDEKIEGKKLSLSFFFYSGGIVHEEFIPPGQTVNHTFQKYDL